MDDNNIILMVVLGLLLVAAVIPLLYLARLTPTTTQHHQQQHPPTSPSTANVPNPPTTTTALQLAQAPTTLHTADVQPPPAETPHTAHPVFLKGLRTIDVNTEFDEVFKTDGQQQITIRHDLKPRQHKIERDALKDTWDRLQLNDEVIRQFLDVVVKHANARTPGGAEERQSILSVSPSFLNPQASPNSFTPEDRSRWLNKAHKIQLVGGADRPNLWQLDIILLPVCQDHHWQLVVVLPKTKQYKLYNSVNQRWRANNDNHNAPLNINDLRAISAHDIATDSPNLPEGFESRQLEWVRFIDSVLQYISDQRPNEAQTPAPYRCSEWVVHFSKCPQQMDGDSCGVYTALNAELLATNTPDTWLKKNHLRRDLLNKYRRRICFSIQTGSPSNGKYTTEPPPIVRTL